MSSRSKGRHYENKTRERLEALGFACEVVKGGSKWQKQVDFFGWADIIALHGSLPCVLLVQVKGGKRWYLPSPADKLRIRAFMAFQPIVRKEWWAWRDRIKEPRIFTL